MKNEQKLLKKPNQSSFLDKTLEKIVYKPAKAVKNFAVNLFNNFINTCKRVYKSIVKGDLWVKGSILFLGLGSFKRKQYVKGALLTLLQALFILFFIFVGFPNLSKLSTLGTVEFEQTIDYETGLIVTNNYDNSFLILLYSLLSIVVLFIAVYAWVKNIQYQYAMELKSKNEEEVPDFKEDIRIMLNDKFHITLLALPISGILIFTIIPLVFMFLIAFTNYDINHLAPMKLFQWVGFENFSALLNLGTNSNFGYAFGKIIIWTFIWAFFATVLNYLFGMALAIWINSKTIKFKKVWRTLFVVTIAIPQFVSLLLVRNFFADVGVLNTILNNIGVVEFVKSIGLINPNLNHIPFLTDPVWSRVMIIVINLWVGIPFAMLITTGVLLNIPSDLYEAATIDGANKFQVFGKITLPYMLFVTGPYLITNFIHNMNNFNVIFLLTSNRGTSDLKLSAVSATDVDLLVTWLFRLTSQDSNYKMASTIGIVIFVVTTVITLFAFNQTIKGEREGTFK